MFDMAPTQGTPFFHSTCLLCTLNILGGYDYSYLIPQAQRCKVLLIQSMKGSGDSCARGSGYNLSIIPFTYITLGIGPIEWRRKCTAAGSELISSHMNDQELQEWTDQLETLRNRRRESYQSRSAEPERRI